MKHCIKSDCDRSQSCRLISNVVAASKMDGFFLCFAQHFLYSPFCMAVFFILFALQDICFHWFCIGARLPIFSSIKEIFFFFKIKKKNDANNVNQLQNREHMYIDVWMPPMIMMTDDNWMASHGQSYKPTVYAKIIMKCDRFEYKINRRIASMYVVVDKRMWDWLRWEKRNNDCFWIFQIISLYYTPSLKKKLQLAIIHWPSRRN